MILISKFYQLQIQLQSSKLVVSVLTNNITTFLDQLVVIITESNMVYQSSAAIVQKLNSTITLRRRGVTILLSLNLSNRIIQSCLGITVIALISIVCLGSLCLIQSFIKCKCLNHAKGTGNITYLNICEDDTILPSILSWSSFSILGNNPVHHIITISLRDKVNTGKS